MEGLYFYVMENKVNFVIYKREEYDKRFEAIKALQKGTTIEEINRTIQKSMDLQLMFVQEMPAMYNDGITFYRVRVLNPNETVAESSQDEFKYPPNPKLGRANIDGQQVLYTSLDGHTAFTEKIKDILPGQSIAYLSKWTIRNIPARTHLRSFLFGLELEELESNYSMILAKAPKEFFDRHHKQLPKEDKENFGYCQKLLCDLFSIGGKEEEFYHLTSAIAYDTFVTSKEKGANMPVICYPSVAKEKQSVNFAFRKDFADDHLFLKEVDKVLITRIDGENVTFNLLNRGVVKDGKIVWHQLDIKMREIDHSKAMVTFGQELEGNYVQLKPNQLLATPCKKCGGIHTYGIREFCEKNGLKETSLLDLLPTLPKEALGDFTMSKELSYEAFLQTTDVYVSDNVTESGKINYLLLPVSYRIEFNSRN